MRATGIAKERYTLHEDVRHRLLTDLGGPEGSLNQKLTAWWELDFKTLRTELKKALKAEIVPLERKDWETAFTTWKAEHQALTERLIAVETEINERVYALFGLTAAEQETLHAHMKHAMIDYPLGAV